MTPFEQFLNRLPQQEASAVRRAVEQGDLDWLCDYARRKYAGHVEHRSSINPAPVPSGKHKPGSIAEAARAKLSPDLQRFYRRQDRLHKLDAELASVDPNSTFGRKLKVEREWDEIKLDLEQDAARTAKDELHQRWMRKDPYASWPVWRDLSLYRKQENKKQPGKDPWAARQLF